MNDQIIISLGHVMKLIFFSLAQSILLSVSEFLNHLVEQNLQADKLISYVDINNESDLTHVSNFLLTRSHYSLYPN